MKKLLILTLIIIAAAFSAQAQSGGMKTLFQGAYPFPKPGNEPVHFRVIRNASAYAKLRKLHAKLPAAKTINFKKSSVAAIYAQLSTPCHSLDLSKNGGYAEIFQVLPKPDAVCTTVIYEAVLIKLIPANLQVRISKNWWQGR